MSENIIQPSFASGELAPSLFARVDLAKYKAGAATMRNFFVDYRGGASTRFGTRYCLQALNSANPVRLIPFSVSFTLNYALEFGQNYIRFYVNGGPVLESTFAISGATKANPCVLTITGNNYNVGDWIFVTSVVGMTQLNGNYYQVSAVSGASVTIAGLNGTAINSTGFTAYVSGGTAARVYTIQSPYLATDLALLKFTQNINTMILTHPNYFPQVLTYTGPTQWAIAAAVFGSSVNAPGTLTLTSPSSSGNYTYSYVVTSIDVNGQESVPSPPTSITLINIQNAGSSVKITWTAVTGAVSYFVYSIGTYFDLAAPVGAVYGFIGQTNTNTFIDQSGIPPNFDITPPIAQNPFLGGSVNGLTLTASGSGYTSVPSVIIAAPGTGQTATGIASLAIVSIGSIVSSLPGFHVGDAVTFSNGVVLIVATVSGGNAVTSFQPLTFPGSSAGSITSGSTPGNPVTGTDISSGNTCTVNLSWGVKTISLIQGGAGYTSAPAVSFSSGSATATSTLGPLSAGNPSCCTFFQQRLVLAGPVTSPQTFYMSDTGYTFNFNISDPVQDSDAITGTILSGNLNQIKSLVSMPSGLIVLTSAGIWQLTGGSAGSAVTPADITAQAQAQNGASDVPPIVANYDILYVQSKGSYVRDAAYNFYTNIYTGTDISVLSNHLFFGYTITQWAWAEEPFKIVWAVRSDGALLSLTYLKEQEIFGWARHDTQGLFQSVCSITEQTSNGSVNAVYLVVQRFIGSNAFQYIERMADRFMPYGLEDAWALDAAVQSAPILSGSVTGTQIQPTSSAVGPGVTFFAGAALYNSGMVGNIIRFGGGIATITAFISSTNVTATITQAITQTISDTTTNLPYPSTNWTIWVPATTFSGLSHLNGVSVNALADGVAVLGLTVANGSVTIPNAASKVTVGLGYVAQLQTMYLDVGEPTVQGKRKKVAALTIRVANSRGLQTGRTFQTLVFINEAGPPILAQPGLITADERVIMDPLWDVPGQICIQESYPYPSTVLGVIPEIAVGDTVK
jgi:hypothetical protein